MKKLGKNLHFHRDQWRARIVIPPELRPFILKADGTPRTQLEEPLGADPKIAHRISHAILAGFHDQLEHARLQLDRSRPTLSSSAKAFYKSELAADDLTRAAGTTVVADPLFVPHLAAKLRLIAKGILIGDEAEAIIGYAVDDLIDRKQAVVTSKADRAELIKHLAQVRLDALAVSQSRDSGSLADPVPVSALVKASDPAPLQPIIVGTVKPVDPNALTLEKLLQLFQSERSDLAERTTIEHAVAIRLLSGFLGKGKAVRAITKADMIAYKNALKETPANAGQRFPGMTIVQAIKANAKLEKPFPTLNARTVNGKWLMHVGTIFRWAMSNDLMSINPAEGVKVQINKGQIDPPRIPFSQDDLKAIFSSDFFTKTGTYNSRHWALLIGLYSGARNSSEFRKTELQHIYKEQGVPVIYLAHASKNRRSRRIVPIHKDLIALGFLEYVEELKKRGESRLFADWEPEDKINRWVNRTYLKKCGITNPLQDFYSMRHTMKTALARYGVSRDISELISGHVDQSVSGTYISEAGMTMAQTMSAAINRVDFKMREYLGHRMTPDPLKLLPNRP